MCEKRRGKQPGDRNVEAGPLNIKGQDQKTNESKKVAVETETKTNKNKKYLGKNYVLQKRNTAKLELCKEEHGK